MAGVSLVSVAKCRISDVGGFGYSQQATHERPFHITLYVPITIALWHLSKSLLLQVSLLSTPT